MSHGVHHICISKLHENVKDIHAILQKYKVKEWMKSCVANSKWFQVLKMRIKIPTNSSSYQDVETSDKGKSIF